MAEWQALQLVPSIATLAVKTAELAKRIIRAPIEAEGLRSKVKRFVGIVGIVENVVNGRSSNTSEDSNERSILIRIENTIDECNRNLQHIGQELQSDVGGLRSRVDFVRRKQEFAEQEKSVAENFEDLKLLFIVLLTVDLHNHQGRNTQVLPGPVVEGARNRVSATVLDAYETHEEASKIHREVAETAGNIDARDSHGWNMLHRAADVLDVEAVKRLVAVLMATAQVEVLDSADESGRTPLMLASDHAEEPDRAVCIARELIRGGCNIDLRDKGVPGRSALCRAIDGSPRSEWRARLVYALVDGGADVSQLEQYGREKCKRYEEFKRARPRAEAPSPATARPSTGSSSSTNRRRSSVAETLHRVLSLFKSQDSILQVAEESSAANGTAS